LDSFVKSNGLKKNFVVEQALLLYMEARRRLPDEAFIPGRVVLTPEAFSRVVALLESPPKPTRKLRELMRGR